MDFGHRNPIATQTALSHHAGSLLHASSLNLTSREYCSIRQCLTFGIARDLRDVVSAAVALAKRLGSGAP